MYETASVVMKWNAHAINNYACNHLDEVYREAWWKKRT